MNARLRIFLLVALFLIPCGTTLAQTTVVTGTVLDPSGDPYVDGSWNVNLYTANVPAGIAVTFQGSNAFQTSYQGQLDDSGNFTVTLPDNNVITPVGKTEWKFDFCQHFNPTTGAPCGSLTILITGASMNISAQIRAVPLPSAFGTVQKVGVWTPGDCPKINDAAGGLADSGLACGGSASAPNQNVIYLSPNCGSQTNCFTVFDNAIQVNDVSTTGGSATITSTSAHWTSADVGKTIVGFTLCGATSVEPTQVIGTTSSNPTIVQVTSATSIVISLAAISTHANSCVDYGTPDDAGFAAADAAAQASTICPEVIFPAGRMFVAQGHFVSTIPSCANSAQFDAGTPAIAPAFMLQGQGQGSTIIQMLPAFGFASCTGGLNADSCWGGQWFTAIKDMEFTGDGNGYNGATGVNKVGIALHCGLLQNVSLLFWGQQSSNQVNGVESNCPVSTSTDTLINVVDDGFGSVGLLGNGNFGGTNVTFADNCQNPVKLNSAADGRIMGGVNVIGQNACGVANAAVLEVSQSGAIFTTDAAIYTESASQHLIQIDGASTVLFSGIGGGGLSTGLTAIVMNNAGAVLKLSKTNLTLGSGGVFCGGTGGKLYDLGGNTFPGTCSSFNIFGSDSITGTAQTAGNIALTSGWSTSSVGTVLGSSQRSQWTVTAAGTPSANPVITVTFPVAFFVAPLCQYQQEGGTFGVITNPAITETATTATLTFSGTPVAAQTYTMNLSCSIP